MSVTRWKTLKAAAKKDVESCKIGVGDVNRNKLVLKHGETNLYNLFEIGRIRLPSIHDVHVHVYDAFSFFVCTNVM